MFLLSSSSPQFTSPEMRLLTFETLVAARNGSIPHELEDALAPAPAGTAADAPYTISHTNLNCETGAAPGVNTTATCPHTLEWKYTQQDAFLGLVCQVRFK